MHLQGPLINFHELHTGCQYRRNKAQNLARVFVRDVARSVVSIREVQWPFRKCRALRLLPSSRLVPLPGGRAHKVNAVFCVNRSGEQGGGWKRRQNVAIGGLRQVQADRECSSVVGGFAVACV
jgi:hypothetical protein